ncbi:hypothetical protein HDU67_005950 [Dinochytrium kinnereticum]|nr:hypothetical protein HDU67_005950 [Dinochytrium kinnereticum]
MRAVNGSWGSSVPISSWEGEVRVGFENVVLEDEEDVRIEGGQREGEDVDVTGREESIKIGGLCLTDPPAQRSKAGTAAMKGNKVRGFLQSNTPVMERRNETIERSIPERDGFPVETAVVLRAIKAEPTVTTNHDPSLLTDSKVSDSEGRKQSIKKTRPAVVTYLSEMNDGPVLDNVGAANDNIVAVKLGFEARDSGFLDPVERRNPSAKNGIVRLNQDDRSLDQDGKHMPSSRNVITTVQEDHLLDLAGKRKPFVRDAKPLVGSNHYGSTDQDEKRKQSVRKATTASDMPTKQSQKRKPSVRSGADRNGMNHGGDDAAEKRTASVRVRPTAAENSKTSQLSSSIRTPKTGDVLAISNESRAYRAGEGMERRKGTVRVDRSLTENVEAEQRKESVKAGPTLKDLNTGVENRQKSVNTLAHGTDHRLKLGRRNGSVNSIGMDREQVGDRKVERRNHSIKDEPTLVTSSNMAKGESQPKRHKEPIRTAKPSTTSDANRAVLEPHSNHNATQKPKPSAKDYNVTIAERQKRSPRERPTIITDRAKLGARADEVEGRYPSVNYKSTLPTDASGNPTVKYKAPLVPTTTRPSTIHRNNMRPTRLNMNLDPLELAAAKRLQSVASVKVVNREEVGGVGKRGSVWSTSSLRILEKADLEARIRGA